MSSCMHPTKANQCYISNYALLIQRFIIHSEQHTQRKINRLYQCQSNILFIIILGHCFTTYPGSGRTFTTYHGSVRTFTTYHGSGRTFTTYPGSERTFTTYPGSGRTFTTYPGSERIFTTYHGSERAFTTYPCLY